MNSIKISNAIAGILVVGLILSNAIKTSACSTFMLHKGDKLIYGHNLNEGDMGVPGIVFVNKRGAFKMGRTLNEMMFKEVGKVSNLNWISRYGSVTFNNFGKDLPDGGMNEAGFYIWEMNENPQYPVGDSLYSLSQMGWMQYLLDNCSTVQEALEVTKNFEIDGWGWHYLLADKTGDCASLFFKEGKMKVNRGSEMPVKGLFNTPYEREMEVARYYENFGGLYKVELDNPKVPRFVKTDWLIKAYDPKENAVDYGFYMLDKIKVNDEPEWSVVFDPVEMMVYFRTRINPAIKYFSLRAIDFSAEAGPCLIQNMDMPEGGDMLGSLHPYNATEMKNLIESLGRMAGEKFFTRGGLTAEEAFDNLTNHWIRATETENQFFKGKWITRPENPEKEKPLTISLETNQEAVFGNVTGSDGHPNKIDHLYMVNNKLWLTFLTKGGSMVEIKGVFENVQFKANAFGIEDAMGSFVFYKEE